MGLWHFSVRVVVGNFVLIVERLRLEWKGAAWHGADRIANGVRIPKGVRPSPAIVNRLEK